jgi:hypothetical protein
MGGAIIVLMGCSLKLYGGKLRNFCVECSAQRLLLSQAGCVASAARKLYAMAALHRELFALDAAARLM